MFITVKRCRILQEKKKIGPCIGATRPRMKKCVRGESNNREPMHSLLATIVVGGGGSSGSSGSIGSIP